MIIVINCGKRNPINRELGWFAKRCGADEWFEIRAPELDSKSGEELEGLIMLVVSKFANEKKAQNEDSVRSLP